MATTTAVPMILKTVKSWRRSEPMSTLYFRDAALLQKEAEDQSENDRLEHLVAGDAFRILRFAACHFFGGINHKSFSEAEHEVGDDGAADEKADDGNP